RAALEAGWPQRRGDVELEAELEDADNGDDSACEHNREQDAPPIPPRPPSVKDKQGRPRVREQLDKVPVRAIELILRERMQLRGRICDHQQPNRPEDSQHDRRKTALHLAAW